MATAKNILGEPLQLCCGNSGFTREGFCYTPVGDFGNHSVCAVVTDEFLEYSRASGNDLITPRPEYDFPGLKAGDKWCLCAGRWVEAFMEGVAPKVVLEATNATALNLIRLEDLKAHAMDDNNGL